MAQVSGAESRSGALSRASPVPALDALARQLEAEQERWFLWLPGAFGCGISLYFMLPAEPWMVAATLPVVAAVALRLVARGTLAVLLSAVLLTAMLGVAAAKLRTEAVRAPVLERQVAASEVRGFVELIEPRPTRGQRLTIRVTGIATLPPEAWPYRVRVRTMIEHAELKPGDAVRLKATLSPPPGPSLPGDYDFARAAWFQALGGVGYAPAAAELDTEADEPPLSLRVSAAFASVRQAIGRRVLAALPGQTGAIANALITGERGGISEATNQAFRDSGLFHILSISGLHMVIMAGAVFFSIRLALAAIPAIALSYPIKKWAAAGAMAGALGYLLISGAAFATVRSYIMISIMFLAVLLDRPALALRNVALAALGILLVWPESLFDPGFQMSFAAVVALVSVYEWVRGREEEQAAWRPRRVIRVGLAVSRRHRAVHAGGEPGGGAFRHLPLPQHAAVRDPGQPAGDTDLQPDRDAGGAGGPGGTAVRTGGRAAVGDGARHRGHGVVRADSGGPAGRGRAHAGHPDARLRADGRRRAVVRAVAHALAAARDRAHRRGVGLGADGPEA